MRKAASSGWRGESAPRVKTGVQNQLRRVGLQLRARTSRKKWSYVLLRKRLLSTGIRLGARSGLEALAALAPPAVLAQAIAAEWLTGVIDAARERYEPLNWEKPLGMLRQPLER